MQMGTTVRKFYKAAVKLRAVYMRFIMRSSQVPKRPGVW